MGRNKPIIEEGFRLLRAWGFRYHTIMTWVKKPGIPTFWLFRSGTEHVLVGYRGRMAIPQGARGRQPTSFNYPVKRCHSAKPDAFYEDLLRYTYGPRLDVFARKVHPGFDGWGDQYEGRATGPSASNGAGSDLGRMSA